MSRQIIIGLDFVRFGAAMLVVFYHLARGLASFDYPELEPFASSGRVGVPIFFVLSGFVICYTAKDSAARFVRSRVLRLVPGIVICATITGALWLHNGTAFEEVAIRWLKSVSFLPFSEILEGVYWTLPIEVIFYALVWLLLLAGMRDRLETLLTGVGLLSAAYIGARLVRKVVGEPAEFPFASLYIQLSEGHPAFLKFGCFFALGGLLYLTMVDRPSPRRIALTLFFTVLGLVYVGGSEIVEHAKPMAILLWFGSVVGIVASVRWNDVLQRFISPRLTRTLGLTTYPLYLLHHMLGLALAEELAALGLSRWPTLVVTISAMFALAVFVALVLEPPVAAVLRRLIDRPGRGPSPAERTIPAGATISRD